MNILNIVNFIRGSEPRNRSLDLLESVKKQLNLSKKYHLPTTFLFMYNALTKPEFVDLFRDKPEYIELGVWLEADQTLVENIGLPWRGREGFDWDWHSNVGLLVGYTPSEREKLLDRIMQTFYGRFEYYPKTVGTWAQDAYSLNYLSEKYGIIAALTCKDQWGTDGYSLWGGYYNQAYYPSKNNAFCPAASKQQQIDVPVFRMLGSDPIRQYSDGVNTSAQLVVSLEPSYPESGGNPEWVDWFLNTIYDPNRLSFGYAQAGQENSFGWGKIRNGYYYQIERFVQLRAEGKLDIMTVADAGAWYRGRYPLTPASSVTAKDGALSTVWYYNRYYRCNIYADKSQLKIRDLMRFDEAYPERYLSKPCPSKDLYYDNLPVIDSYRWASAQGSEAGGYLLRGGKPVVLTGALVTEKTDENTLKVLAPAEGGNITIWFRENSIDFEGGCVLKIVWAPGHCNMQIDTDGSNINCRYEGWDYSVQLKGAKCTMIDNGMLICPQSNTFSICI